MSAKVRVATPSATGMSAAMRQMRYLITAAISRAAWPIPCRCERNQAAIGIRLEPIDTMIHHEHRIDPPERQVGKIIGCKLLHGAVNRAPARRFQGEIARLDEAV